MIVKNSGVYMILIASRHFNVSETSIARWIKKGPSKHEVFIKTGILEIE